MVVGAGQTPGETLGNGRATAILFAREGAQVLCVDRDLASAEETAQLITDAGGTARVARADVTDEEAVRAAVNTCVDAFGRIDILHNNVGISLAGGDAEITEIDVESFDRVIAVNLRGMVLACKHTLPLMREQRRGVILNISSVAAVVKFPYVGYKTSKAAVVALTQQIAANEAKRGIRANAILPGLMNTPMAIAPRVAATGKSWDQVVAERDANVPLGRKMGTAWDVANAALFLASDEAGFITGAALPVDGGSSVKVG
ncbi:MAG: SDR family oxidoreductase [Acidimicrobiales bacterium]|nr:SDR family oxidoreductase [Acidimicrobiales bacterium]